MLRTVIMYYLISCLSAAAFGGLAYYLYLKGADNYRTSIDEPVNTKPVAKKGDRLKPSDVVPPGRPGL